MVKEITGCELELTSLSEEHYTQMKAFFETYQLTAIEAQLILEISNCRRHHIDVDTLSKKIPKEFGTGNFEALIKKLIKDGYVES